MKLVKIGMKLFIGISNQQQFDIAHYKNYEKNSKFILTVDVMLNLKQMDMQM
jgi:ribosomal protein L1